MRTFHVNAPIIMGAGCLALCVLASAPTISHAEPQLPLLRGPELPISPPTDARPAAPGIRTTPSFAALRAKLDASDREVALKTLLVALREVGDGSTLVWRRPSRQLIGEITPISAFRDDKGRICRRVSYKLILGSYSREVTGNACREADGSWRLSG